MEKAEEKDSRKQGGYKDGSKISLKRDKETKQQQQQTSAKRKM